MQFKQGTLSCPASAGTQAITGVGFQPKYGIFWATRRTASGFGANRSLSYGFADTALTNLCVAHISTDNVGVATEVGRRQTTDCICLISCTGSIVSIQAAADVQSWDSDGFTLNWSSVESGAKINYLVVGGSDITNTWAGTINTPTSTGSQAYTSPGFQPDLLLCASLGESTTMPGSFTQARLALGAASGATNEQSLTVHDSDNIPTQVASIATPNILQIENLGSTKFLANLTSMDATGFTLNWSTVNATSAATIWLAVKGGTHWVGTDTQKTSTGTQAKTGVGFRPGALLFMGVNRASPGTRDVTQSRITIGGTDGTNQAVVWGQSTDAVSTTDANSYQATDGVILHGTNPSTIDAKASISSLDSDGYTLSWDTADATAREFIVIAFPRGTNTLTGSASLTVTAGIGTAGTRTVTGSASLSVTAGIGTAGSSSIHGSTSLAVTASFATAATRERRASASSTTTVGITTAGAAGLFGAASQSVTVGIAVAGALLTHGAVSAGLNLAIDTRGVRGKPITLVPTSNGAITLEPKEPELLP